MYRLSGSGWHHDAVLASKPIQNDPDLFFGLKWLSLRALVVLDYLLAMAFAYFVCLSHDPLLSSYDEPEILFFQIWLFGLIDADVRHQRSCARPRM